MTSSDKLLIGILGNASSGKTYTWNTLFGREVRTGKNLRRLYFNETDYVNVFLVSRSPGKRRQAVSSILGKSRPDIVLCSLQYQHSLLDTLKFFRQNAYLMYIQWLNPGYADSNEVPLFYDLEMINRILSDTAFLSVRNGKKSAEPRTEDILDFLYGWAGRRGLIRKKGQTTHH
jgi:hypothetical protein